MEGLLSVQLTMSTKPSAVPADDFAALVQALGDARLVVGTARIAVKVEDLDVEFGPALLRK